jgi:hypothetical protein
MIVYNKSIMKYIIVMFYLRVIRPVMSWIVFIITAAKYSKEERKKAQKYLDDLFSSLTTVHDIITMNNTLTDHGFTWKPDPGINGIFDFSPEKLWLFIARKGDDCDGWAELNFQACKKINLHPEMWVIMDGWKPQTIHVIIICYNPGDKKYYLCNNDDVRPYQTKEKCFGVFTESPPLMVNGKYIHLDKFLMKNNPG